MQTCDHLRDPVLRLTEDELLLVLLRTGADVVVVGLLCTLVGLLFVTAVGWLTLVGCDQVNVAGLRFVIAVLNSRNLLLFVRSSLRCWSSCR